MNGLCKTSSQILLNGKCPESPSCKEVFGIMLGTEKKITEAWIRLIEYYKVLTRRQNLN